MYDEVLVPTDGSDPASVAVDEAVALAATANARVHFLHVVDVGTEMSASAVGTIADDLTETLESVADDALDDAVAVAEEADVRYERETLEGVPHEAIEAYGREHDVDLIVVGTSGHSGLKEDLLGSTTDRVVQSADSSVLVARP
ncbi:universal stress protein [Halorubellus sp. JP-L1]|uniref:universal stress protein n=1 Tax=Halorubellus sp. JP-L1 TaxID=2715753 RepID=UPI00140A1CF3|nr:universal stress protein [Halorubellus sp. JP-L1]NHN41121.1 universal stress protein [Halorubellus sp. JP-L1]